MGFRYNSFTSKVAVLQSIDNLYYRSFVLFFSDWFFFHNHLRITGLAVNGEGIPLTRHYNFNPFHRHL